MLWIALAGLPRLLRKAPVIAAPLAVATLLALYVNASVADWWAGASFGSRRFDGALAFFALGLAAAIEWLLPRLERSPVAVVSLLLAPFALWNFLMMGAYFGAAIPPDGPASFRQAAADGSELLYRRTGYPFSWPAAVRDLSIEGRAALPSMTSLAPAWSSTTSTFEWETPTLSSWAEGGRFPGEAASERFEKQLRKAPKST